MAAVADALSAGFAACVLAAEDDVMRLRDILEQGRVSGALEVSFLLTFCPPSLPHGREDD
jgi:hypothetical protein